MRNDLGSMAAVRPTCFCRPDLLRRMKPACVLLLFAPASHRKYLADRGIVLPEDLDESYDFVPLGLVLSNHRSDTPPQLVEELELLAMIANSQSTFHFEEECQEIVRQHMEDGETFADLAVKILRHAPHIAWKEFDRRALKCQRAFESYSVAAGLTDLPPTDERIGSIETLLSAWFEKNARTSSCRVRTQEDADGISFIVRHGDLLNRMGVIADDGSSESKLLRPERLDLIHFRKKSREWLISGVGDRIKDEYRRAFGLLFHGTANALSPSRRYSLEPLIHGKSCLDCRTGPISLAVLKSVTLQTQSGQLITIKGADVFASLGELYSPEMRFIEATIALKVVGRRPQVKITIRPEHNKITGTSNIPVVEAWLETTGFCITHAPAALLDIA